MNLSKGYAHLLLRFINPTSTIFPHILRFKMIKLKKKEVMKYWDNTGNERKNATTIIPSRKEDPHGEPN